MSGYEMPPKPRAGGEDNPWTSATPLSNQDFRKLLATPRPGSTPAQGFKKPQRSTPKPASDSASEGGFKKPPKPKAKKPVKAKDEGEKEDDGPRYRDRAEERRKGLNPDYLRVEEELSSVLQARGVGVTADVINPQALTVEESKFLGGDVEHTHLVKGLDYALLQKERMKMQKQQEERAAKEQQQPKQMKKEEMRFVSAAGRGVFDSLFNAPKTDVREMFLPRRTAFVFEFDNPEAVDSDIPTTLRRSRADCPAVQEAMFAGTDCAVLDRIAKILAYVKVAAGKGGKKVKKQEKDAFIRGILAGGEHKVEQYVVKGAPAAAAPAAPPPPAAAAAAGKPVDDDEDIFGDAGDDYKPTVKRKEPAAAAAAGGGAGAAAGKRESYFDKKDDMADIPMPGQHKQPALPPPPKLQQQQHHEADMDIEDGEVAHPPAAAAAGADHMAQQQQQQYYQGQYDYAQYQQYSQQYNQGQYDQQYYAGAYPQGQYPGYGADYQQQQQQQQQGYPQQGYLPPPPGQQQQQQQQQQALTQQDKDKGLATVFKQDGERWRVSKDAQLKGFADEAYEECFPEYATAGEVVGSDDEDVGAMDAGGKGKSRYDFATEEEWQSYKSSQGAMPKSAFQFGVKVADGRKDLKEMRKQESKLNSQLAKIEARMREQGHEHSTAFRKPAREEEPLPMPKKRQRI